MVTAPATGRQLGGGGESFIVKSPRSRSCRPLDNQPYPLSVLPAVRPGQQRDPRVRLHTVFHCWPEARVFCGRTTPYLNPVDKLARHESSTASSVIRTKRQTNFVMWAFPPESWTKCHINRWLWRHFLFVWNYLMCFSLGVTLYPCQCPFGQFNWLHKLRCICCWHFLNNVEWMLIFPSGWGLCSASSRRLKLMISLH